MKSVGKEFLNSAEQVGHFDDLEIRHGYARKVSVIIDKVKQSFASLRNSIEGAFHILQRLGIYFSGANAGDRRLEAGGVIIASRFLSPVSCLLFPPSRLLPPVSRLSRIEQRTRRRRQ